MQEWLDIGDPPGSVSGDYEPVHVIGDASVVRGVTRYAVGHPEFPAGAEYHNLFVLRFDGDDRVQEYREWYMRRPSNE